MTKPLYACLWFDGNAKEAAEYYCSVFKNGKIISENPMVVIFEINGTKFMGLNGGNHFKFNEAVSFVIDCENQDEVDYYWNTLTYGGEESMCGWLKDKFGVSWQVVPTMISSIMSDPEKMQRAMPLIMQMKKIDISVLENA